MPRLSLGLGAQTQIKVGGAAPSGIVAATAGNLIISFGPPGTSFYFKNSNVEWYTTFGEDPEFQQLATLTYGATWSLQADGGTTATNPSVNPLIIPTTGWTYIVGEGPAVTITAYP